MNNHLEDFIKNNKEKFDSSEPQKEVWDKIQANLKIKNKVSTVVKLSRYWWAAAAALFLTLTVTIYYIAHHSNTNEQLVKTITPPPKELTDAIDTSYTTQMNTFAYIIQVKQNELKRNSKVNPDLYNQFIKDNNKLDSSYNYLKSELTKNPNKELLLEAMIGNLQLKLELLNRQLQIIKQSKNKTSNNENKTI